VAEAFHQARDCGNLETRGITFRKIAFSISKAAQVKCHLCSYPLASNAEAAAHYPAVHPSYRRIVFLEELCTLANRMAVEN